MLEMDIGEKEAGELFWYAVDVSRNVFIFVLSF